MLADENGKVEEEKQRALHEMSGGLCEQEENVEVY